MSEHVHKYNGTLISGKGRCSCGAWGTWDRTTRTYSEVTHPPTVKGLESRLQRIKDPDTTTGGLAEPVYRGNPYHSNKLTREPAYNHDLTTKIKDE